jgi:hypothetical protein
MKKKKLNKNTISIKSLFFKKITFPNISKQDQKKYRITTLIENFKKPLPFTLDWVASSLQDQPCFF